MRDLMSGTGGLSRLANENKTVLERLIEVTERFLSDIKGNSTEAKALRNEAEALVDRMYRAQGLQNEQKRGTLTTENNEQGGRHSVDREATESETGSGDNFTERKDDFVKRSRDALREVVERGDFVLAYSPYRGSDSGIGAGVERDGRLAREVKTELEHFGIDSFIYDPGTLEVNGSDNTYVVSANEAVTIYKQIVGVNGRARYMPKAVAAHEAFHVWSESAEASEYKDSLSLHLNYSSPDTIGRLMGIQERYLDGKTDVIGDDVGTETVVEELYAFIAGALHNGGQERVLRNMLTDYDTVKTAWENLVRAKTGTNYTFETRLSADAEGAFLLCLKAASPSP